jgi:hypothetical protein
MLDLLEWLASVPPDERDRAVDAHLGIAAPVPPCPCPGEHRLGYHASGVAPILRMLIDVPVVRGDVLVDLGAGLGKVVFLTHLLTGATARGIEIEPELVRRSHEAAARLAMNVGLAQGDARTADLHDGTVFFLYLPFTGPVLAEVLGRLRDIASRRAIVVCALGVDLDREARWLARRPTDEFWLAIYDSVVPGAPGRVVSERPPVSGACAEAIARARPHAARST